MAELRLEASSPAPELTLMSTSWPQQAWSENHSAGEGKEKAALSLGIIFTLGGAVYHRQLLDVKAVKYFNFQM